MPLGRLSLYSYTFRECPSFGRVRYPVHFGVSHSVWVRVATASLRSRPHACPSLMLDVPLPRRAWVPEMSPPVSSRPAVPVAAARQWYHLILDEAQNIKNFKSQRWQTLLTFNSQRRLLLTGTPLQNSLMELWSLMHFLMPHVFRR